MMQVGTLCEKISKLVVALALVAGKVTSESLQLTRRFFSSSPVLFSLFSQLFVVPLLLAF